MKQNLINREDTSPKSGKLSIALYPNPLNKGRGGLPSYYARVVNRRKLDMDDIFNDLISENAGIDKDQMRRSWNTVLNAIAMRISSGVSVDFGLGVLSPAISGSFASEQSEFSRARNSITVQYRPSRDLQRTMDRLEPVITRGNSCRPEITKVFDHGSGWDSANLKEGESMEVGTISRGDLLIIEGKTLRIAGDGDSVGVWFDNIDDPAASIRLDAQALCRNRPSLLECIVPRELAAKAAYRLRIVTRHLAGNKTREKAQSYTFPSTFIAR